MFSFPKQAEFNRPLPKSKIYAFARPTRAVKNQIVSGILDIVWKYKLAPETVNLPARHGIHEIQVFEIRLKTGEIGEDVLRAIDEAIPSPIFHHLLFQDRERWAAAYKRPATVGNRQVVESYFHTAWGKDEGTRMKDEEANVSNAHSPFILHPSTFNLHPTSFPLDLSALYEEMLSRVIPLARRPGESLAALVDRSVQLRAKERECRDLEARLRKERQFNRKVEINAAIRAARMSLAALQHS